MISQKGLTDELDAPVGASNIMAFNEESCRCLELTLAKCGAATQAVAVLPRARCEGEATDVYAACAVARTARHAQTVCTWQVLLTQRSTLSETGTRGFQRRLHATCFDSKADDGNPCLTRIEGGSLALNVGIR